MHAQYHSLVGAGARQLPKVVVYRLPDRVVYEFLLVPHVMHVTIAALFTNSTTRTFLRSRLKLKVLGNVSK